MLCGLLFRWRRVLLMSAASLRSQQSLSQDFPLVDYTGQLRILGFEVCLTAVPTAWESFVVASPVGSYAAHEWAHQRASKHFRLHWLSKAEWHPSVHRVHSGRQRQCGFLCERLFQGTLAVS